MTLDDEAVKRVLNHEFGIEGVDDPNKLTAILAEKVATLDANGRTALRLKLAQAMKDLRAGRPSRLWPRLAVISVAIASWLIWPPLTVVLLIFRVSGCFRRKAIRHSLFWTAPIVPVVIGMIYGLFIAGVVAVATHLLLTNTILLIVFRTFGLGAASYVGYGASSGSFASPGDGRRKQAATIAVLAYLAVTVVLWLRM